MAKGSQHVSSFPSFLLPAQFVPLLLLCQAFAEPAQCNNSAHTLLFFIGLFSRKANDSCQPAHDGLQGVLELASGSTWLGAR